MSRSNSQGSQSPKASYPVKEPRSAQELCEQLKQLTQQPNWKSGIAERFVSLIVNSNRQYQLDTQQRDNLAETINNRGREQYFTRQQIDEYQQTIVCLTCKRPCAGTCKRS